LVVRAAGDVLSDFTPARLVLLEETDDEHVLLLRPLHLDNFWVKVMVPSLATLLSDPAREQCSDLGPVSSAIGEDDLAK